MKKLYLLGIISFLIVNLHSQPKIWIFDNPTLNKSSINSMLIMSDSLIIVGADVNNASCFYPELFAYDFDGNLLWSQEIGCHVLTEISGTIISVGYNIGADDVGGDEFINITKLTNHGDTLYN